MKKLLLPSLTLGLTLTLTLALVFAGTFATEAQAGTARSGQGHTGSKGKGGGLSKVAKKLVGTWRMVAYQVGTTRRPFPGSKVFRVTLGSDGTVLVTNLPPSQAKRFNKARWTVKGKQVVITLNKTVQKFDYSFKANELWVSMPGTLSYSLIMVRVLKKAKP